MHYTCVGVGVGPANLSLACLLGGHPEIDNVFLDRKRCFSWHDEQQIPGATLQVSALKDLVTLSDPTSNYSFLAYLHEQGKIYHFINAQFDAVPRSEFRNYLEWASGRNPNVVFGESIEEVTFDGDVFRVATSQRDLTADNIVVGIGSQPWAPDIADCRPGTSQFHVNEYLPRSRSLAGRRVAVVGGGQSGAEAVLDLISRPEKDQPRQVQWISRRPNFLPIDDTPFTNDYFMPCYSDYFYELDRPAREGFNVDHILASDGISESTLREIYQQAYLHRFVHGADELLGLYPNRSVTAVHGGGANPWELTLEDRAHRDRPLGLRADVVVWATGFRPASPVFLDPIAHRIERESDEFRIDGDFAVRWDGPPDRNVFLQNAARGQRGLADPNLSLVAWRSQLILDRLRGVRSTAQLASFISWRSPANHLDAQLAAPLRRGA